MFVGDREVGDRMHFLLLIGLPSHHHNSQCGWLRSQFCTQYTGNNAWDGAMHYTDVITGAMASQITSLTIVYSTVYSGADQRKHQSSASLCTGNSPGIGEFPAQMASNAEHVSIWWRHHGTVYSLTRGLCWCLLPELRSNEGNKKQNNARVSA